MATTFGKLDFHTAFKPSSAFPLDSREYFESYAEALAAAQKAVEAGSADSNYYYGQVLRVVENGVASLYQIQPDNTLTPVGGAVTDEALTGRVDDLEERADSLETVIGYPADSEAGTEASGIFAEIANRPTTDAMNSAIAQAIASVDHLSYKKVESKESINVEAEDADKYIYLVPNTDAGENVYDEYMVLDGALEMLGNTKVDLSDYLKAADAETTYVKIVEGQRMMTTAEGDKLNSLLGIKSVSAELVLGEDNGELSIGEVAMDKVTGLGDALDGKVDKEDGSRLINDEEIKKLAGLILNEDGTVEGSTKVNAESVTGLAELLAGKVDVDENARLMTNDEGEKLSGIESGAQANKIEKIMMNGTELTITEKAVDIPMSTAETAGIVVGSNAENGVAVAEDGTMSVNSVNVEKLVQTDGHVLILNGGSAGDA